jgi:phosphoribosylanthranilate isomerase
MVKVKICGLTNLDDALKACEYGADLLGFIFVENTPRCVDPDSACRIVREVRKKYSSIGAVGLFKDAKINDVVGTVLHCDMDYIQLHGHEVPYDCGEIKKKLAELKAPVQHRILKVFKVDEKILPQGEYVLDDYKDADYFVFDTYHPEVPGGTGARFDWEVLNREKGRIKKEFFIAGGLNPGNVSEAVSKVRPYGVDVSSGVEEAPGKKNWKLLKEFIENAKKI